MSTCNNVLIKSIELNNNNLYDVIDLKNVECAKMTIMPLTIICIRFRSVSILKSIRPSAFVLGVGCVRLSNTVSAFKALRPFTPIYPSTSCLHTQAMSFSVLPLTLKTTTTAIQISLSYCRVQ